MDKSVNKPARPKTFNSPLEAGLRAVTLLAAAYPRAYDLQRMVAYDHILVHTSNFGGPRSLHPESPMQSAELLVRRGLVERGLLLMATRDLVVREVTEYGIFYMAGENAAPFLSSIEARYSITMMDCAKWVINNFGDYDDQTFKGILRSYSGNWIEEFQAAEHSLGSE